MTNWPAFFWEGIMHFTWWGWVLYAASCGGWFLWARGVVLDHTERLDAIESIYPEAQR
jgi:hypothetical protein